MGDMNRTIIVPEHLTTEFVTWLGAIGLNVVENAGHSPALFEIREMGGGPPVLTARPGDTLEWDGQARLSVRRSTDGASD
jgi:hypothetical protein